MIAVLVAGFVALIIVVAVTGKYLADHIADTLLAIEGRETERRRQAGIQSGFTAGWHGAGGRRG